MAVAERDTDMQENLVDGIRRTRRFNIGLEHFEDGNVLPVPWVPPREKIFDLFFFRQLFDFLQQKSLKSEVPLVAVRNLSFKIMDAMDIGQIFEQNFFGNLSKPACSWDDLRNALTSVGHPTIPLTPVERIYVTLDDQESSRVAKIWFYFIMVVTVANLLTVLDTDTAGYACEWLRLGVDRDTCSEHFKVFCIVVFTFEYVAKLMCVPWVRTAVVFPEQIKYLRSDDWYYRPHSRMDSIMSFVKNGSNLVDLVAITPFWLTLVIGPILPSTSFLRMIRLARLFRIFKTARYLDMLQVLALTLWKSVSMVLILFVLVSIIGLVAGCLLQQFENESEAFDTVPQAWYWIFSRLISMKDTPYRDGMVTSICGIVLLATTMALKGVLWIVPIARIKQIFAHEYSAVVRVNDMRRLMVQELLEVHKGGDRKLVTGRNGSTCARIELMGAETALEALVPLPILLDHDTHIHEMEIKCTPSDVTLAVRMDWTPNPMMHGDKAGLPVGKLSLRVVAGKGLPSNVTGASWEVPVAAFGKACKKVSWNTGNYFGEATEFAIDWSLSTVASKPNGKSQGHVQDVELEHAAFQQQVLHLLHEHSDLLHGQQRLISEQSSRIEALEQAAQAKK